MRIKLTAMPYLTDVIFDFGLEEEGSNREIAKKLLTEKNEIFWKTDTHEFFLTGDWENGGCLVLYNVEEKLVGYFAEFKTEKFLPGFEKHITQVKVWQSLTDSGAPGMARKIFFEMLLPKYNAIMSDKLHTLRGKEFWIRNMNIAELKGYHVALYNYSSKELEYKPEKKKLREWLKDCDAWGITNEHLNQTFIIYK